MMKKIIKISCLTIFNIAIICSVNKAKGFPLPTLDIARLKTSVQNTMTVAQEIKQEVESNIELVEEIQHGGFASAAGKLFGKIQNGDYDRFGKNLKAVKNNTKDAARNIGAAKRQKKTMKEEMAKGKSREEALKIAQKNEAERQMKKQEEQYEKDLNKAKAKAVERRAKELRKENSNLTEKEAYALAEKENENKTLEQLRLENQSASKLNKAYNWLKNNQGVTSFGAAAIQAAQDGNWGQALAAAGNSAGSGLSNSGHESWGAMIQSGAAMAGSVADASQAGSLGEAFQILKNSNGGAQNNFLNMGQAVQDYRHEKAVRNAEVRQDNWEAEMQRSESLQGGMEAEMQKMQQDIQRQLEETRRRQSEEAQQNLNAALAGGR